MLKPKSKLNKSAWIRQQDITLPASEVVKKAKEEGITFSVQMVHAIRSNARRKSAVVTRSPGRPPRIATAAAAGPPRSSSRPASDVTQQFVHLLASIGFLRAEGLFADLRTKLGQIDLSR